MKNVEPFAVGVVINAHACTQTLIGMKNWDNWVARRQKLKKIYEQTCGYTHRDEEASLMSASVVELII